MDFIDTERFADIIFPTAEELEEAEYVSNLSETERELYFSRKALRKGNMTQACYEYAVGCIIFWAIEDGKITIEEASTLASKYNPKLYPPLTERQKRNNRRREAKQRK